MTTPPSIDCSATPANEWAESTNSILGVHATSTPNEGPAVPGSFPGESAPNTNANEISNDLNGNGGTFVQRAMTSTGQAAKAYLPQSVAAYLPSSTSTGTEMAPPHPGFATASNESTRARAFSNLSTEAQAGSLASPAPDSTGDLHTSTVRPIAGSKFSENLVTPPGMLLAGLSSPSVPSAPIPAEPMSTARAGPDTAHRTPYGVLGSDSSSPLSYALNSSSPAPNGNYKPTTDPTYHPHSASLPATWDSLVPPEDNSAPDNFTSNSTADGGDADRGGNKEPKKPKRMQRLKDKMHVGHSHA
ncbi:hypothetical protein DFH07DRAFT_962183 [Mycena maculata]|uniref:Uncharacterized protein n=1 Tax=Mycena maculata TaxID=230809 RepID=A0AAD7N7X6_9AGAR|nr:hypothetical protein DFH07DRAFT_962183 [Mycena maculata]